MSHDALSCRVPLPERDAAVRNGDFDEVATGYTAEMARAEAERCLNCKKKPCVDGCPVNVDIPAFIAALKEGDPGAAYDIIKATNALPAVCGRVCPQENQCEGRCVRGKKGDAIAIGALERFCADHAEAATKAVPPAPNGKKVAVIGSGPGGLTAAGDLVKAGFDVTVFEALHAAGGVLRYGIPGFRLPKDLVRAEIRGLEAQGVRIVTDTVVGKTVTLGELLRKEDFDAIYIGTGAGLPHFLDIPGEGLNGVYSANEFLTRLNLMGAYRFPSADTPVKVGERVIVVGGGNVAMDAARCAKRLKAAVTIVYRRSEKEMPARSEEVRHAKEEGVEIMALTNPVAILGNDRYEVTAVRCQKMTLGEADDDGRRRPLPLADSERDVAADTVIIAVGNAPNPLLTAAEPALATDAKGRIITDEAGRTSSKGVYAGGDAVTGAATVISAMGAGKKAAAAIAQDLLKGGK